MNLKEKGKRLQKIEDLEYIRINTEMEIHAKAT